MAENPEVTPVETPAEGAAPPSTEVPVDTPAAPPSEPAGEAQPTTATPVETPKVAPAAEAPKVAPAAEVPKATPEPKPVHEAPKVIPEAKKDSVQKVALEPNRSIKSLRVSKELSARSGKSKSGIFKSKSALFSTLNIKRGSYATYQAQSKAPRYMNSYKLNSEKPFNADKVHSIILKVVGEIIPDNMTYDPEICANKAKTLSHMIRSRVKDQEFDRYKFVCLVTIGEKKSHDIFTGVRFLWDSERDRFATHMHENMYLFCVATVFGLYYE